MNAADAPESIRHHPARRARVRFAEVAACTGQHDFAVHDDICGKCHTERGIIERVERHVQALVAGKKS